MFAQNYQANKANYYINCDIFLALVISKIYIYYFITNLIEPGLVLSCLVKFFNRIYNRLDLFLSQFSEHR